MPPLPTAPFPFDLSPEQQAALPVLDWLFDTADRRQGRSYIMALALVRTAARQPGLRVNYVDHAASIGMGVRTQANLIVCYVRLLVDTDPSLNPDLRLEHFTVTPRSPIHDWMPPTARVAQTVVESSTTRPSLWDLLSADDF